MARGDHPLTATRAWKQVGIRDHALSAAFKEATGKTLRAYIEQRRLEVADRMLREHDGLEIMPISFAVGYENHDTFAAAYDRWLKESPSAARSKPRPPEIDYLTWRWGMRGELDDDAAWDVQEVWLRLYPPVEARLRERYGAVGEPWIDVDGERHERWSAEGLWSDLRDLPFEAQRRQVRRSRFRSTALFDLLRHRSRTEGRKDRRRGVELAELALASLERGDRVFGERETAADPGVDRHAVLLSLVARRHAAGAPGRPFARRDCREFPRLYGSFHGRIGDRTAADAALASRHGR